jgi:hypothetical protein
VTLTNSMDRVVLIHPETTKFARSPRKTKRARSRYKRISGECPGSCDRAQSDRPGLWSEMNSSRPCQSCPYSKPKPGRIGDGVRRGLVLMRCGRASVGSENAVHSCAMRDASGPGCSRKRSSSERDAAALRRTRSRDRGFRAESIRWGVRVAILPRRARRGRMIADPHCPNAMSVG